MSWRQYLDKKGNGLEVGQPFCNVRFALRVLLLPEHDRGPVGEGEGELGAAVLPGRRHHGHVVAVQRPSVVPLAINMNDA